MEIVTSSPGVVADGVTRLGAPTFTPAAIREGLQRLDAGDIDVLHAHLGVASPLAFFLARGAARRGIPTVVTVHSLWSRVRPIMAAMDAWGRWSRLPIQWTAVSEAAAAPVRRLMPPHVRVEVIANGINPGDWEVGTPVRATQDDVVVAAVMRLALRKRPLPLLRMLGRAQHALGEGRRLRLVIAGEGRLRPLMRWYAARHGLSGQVEFVGRVDRDGVRRLLRSADMFVAPARLESFGIAALEARCAGVPVVAMASGGVGEFVEHGVEGLLCADDADMARAISALAADDLGRERIADHNRSTTCRVTWEEVLDRTDAAYERARVAVAAPEALEVFEVFEQILTP